MSRRPSKVTVPFIVAKVIRYLVSEWNVQRDRTNFPQGEDVFLQIFSIMIDDTMDKASSLRNGGRSNQNAKDCSGLSSSTSPFLRTVPWPLKELLAHGWSTGISTWTEMDTRKSLAFSYLSFGRATAAPTVIANSDLDAKSLMPKSSVSTISGFRREQPSVW